MEFASDRRAGTLKGYVVLLLDITDADAYADYLEEASETVNEHGGQFLLSEEHPDIREGSWPCKRTIIIEFPSTTDAIAWYTSDDYQPLIAERQRSADSRVAILEGSPN